MEKTWNKKNKTRLIAVVALIATAACAFAYGVASLLKTETGWRTVECTANAANCSSEFIFTYEPGASGQSPTAQLRAVTNLYNEKAAYYYRLFHAGETFADTVNVASLNAAPNTALAVDAPLYRALETMEKDGGRWLYLAPLYAYYDTLFSSSYDEDAATWDPAENEALRAEYDRTLAFARDDAHVHLEFEDGRVTLFVSDAYLAYAKEVGVRAFIDFYWMKNAFIADAFASDLTEAGFTHGVISSRDGYIRNLDPGETEYAFDIFCERDGMLDAAGVLTYRGAAAICTLRPYIVDDAEGQYYYAYGGGRRVTRYISPADGLSRDAGTVAVCSKRQGCAALLLGVLPAYLDGDPGAWRQTDAGIIYQTETGMAARLPDGFTYTENKNAPV